MDALKRVIENETQALNTFSVINQNVTRWSFIKEIEPKVLIDYALANDLGKPELSKMTECLEITVSTPNGNILIQSTKLKVKTTYEF